MKLITVWAMFLALRILLEGSEGKPPRPVIAGEITFLFVGSSANQEEVIAERKQLQVFLLMYICLLSNLSLTFIIR